MRRVGPSAVILVTWKLNIITEPVYWQQLIHHQALLISNQLLWQINQESFPYLCVGFPSGGDLCVEWTALVFLTVVQGILLSSGIWSRALQPPSLLGPIKNRMPVSYLKLPCLTTITGLPCPDPFTIVSNNICINNQAQNMNCKI